MKTRSIVLLLVVGLLAALLTACGGGTPNVDWEFKVTGDVGTPLTLSYAELTEMDQVDLTDILMAKSLGEDEITSWSGVPVADLLAQAGVSDYATITAIAGDGYAIEIPREEMQDAIVALKRDGEWIPNVAEEEGKGPIRLVSPETPANRWVFQLQELRVSAAPAAVETEDAILHVTGGVNQEKGWSETALRTMPTLDAEYDSGDGPETYTGVALNALLDEAGAPAGGTLALVADDGYSVELDLAEVRACADCIVIFRDDGLLMSVMPGFAKNTRVKGLVEIQVSGDEADASNGGGIDGETLLSERCVDCHGLDRTTSAQKTEAAWDQTVTRMVTHGANLTATEQETLVKYLAETYGP